MISAGRYELQDRKRGAYKKTIFNLSVNVRQMVGVFKDREATIELLTIEMKPHIKAEEERNKCR